MIAEGSGGIVERNEEMDRMTDKAEGVSVLYEGVGNDDCLNVGRKESGLPVLSNFLVGNSTGANQSIHRKRIEKSASTILAQVDGRRDTKLGCCESQ